jgi:hypothetical protein
MESSLLIMFRHSCTALHEVYHHDFTFLIVSRCNTDFVIPINQLSMNGTFLEDRRKTVETSYSFKVELSLERAYTKRAGVYRSLPTVCS